MNHEERIEAFKSEYAYLVRHAGEPDEALAMFFSSEEVSVLRLYEGYLAALSRPRPRRPSHD